MAGKRHNRRPAQQPPAPRPPAPAPVPAPQPPARPRRRPVLLGLLTLVVLLLGWRLWGWVTAPAPPAVSLADADPAVVQAVEAGRREVWWSPRSAAAWGRLGQLLRAHGHGPEANRCFAEAGRLDPDDPRWPYLHGTGLRADDPEAAIPHLERAAALSGDTPDAPRLTLAEVCLQQGRLDDAERHFRQVLESDPGNARAHLGLGRLAIERGRPGDALGPLERAAASPLTQQAARTLLAQAHQQLGDAAAAGRERGRALDLPPDPPWPDPYQEEVLALVTGKQARLARLQTLHRQGRLAEWRELARQLEADYPDVYWLVEGRGQMARGNVGAAEAAFRKAVELAPGSAEAHFDLGNVLLVQRDLPAAADAFRKVTELEPGYGPAHLRLGQCLEADGDRAGALSALQAAVRTMPQQADAHRELGALLAKAGRPDEAAASLRQALQLRPDDAKARELLDAVTRRAAGAERK